MPDDADELRQIARSLAEASATPWTPPAARSRFGREVYFLSDVARALRLCPARTKVALTALGIKALKTNTRPHYSGRAVRTLGGRAPETASPLLKRSELLVVLGMEEARRSTLVRRIRAGAFPEYEIIPGCFRYRREDVENYAADVAEPAVMTLEQVAAFWGVSRPTASNALAALGVKAVDRGRFPAEVISSLGGTVAPTRAPFLRRPDVAAAAKMKMTTLERRIAARLLPECLLPPRTYLYRVEDVATFIAAENLFRAHEREEVEKMLMAQQILRLSERKPHANITPTKNYTTNFGGRNVRWVR